MKQFRTVWTTEPNCSLHASCYWFDTEASPMMSKGGLGNQSNMDMIETPTRSVTIVDHSTTHRALERVRHLLMSRLLPAIALAGLVFWQLDALISELQELN